MSIEVTTFREWELKDGSDPKAHSAKLPTVLLPIGTHQLERIRCPTGHDCNWLVLPGTKIGMSEGYWKDWINYTGNDEFNIHMTENGEVIQ